MIRKFLNREKELDYLNKCYRTKGFQFIIIYGRRRIGKTELIKKFIENKPNIYFLSDRQDPKRNIARLSRQTASHFNDITPAVIDFRELFIYIKKRIEMNRLIIIIDEFPYLVSGDPSIPSVIQFVIDEELKNSNLYIILLGSSVQMMETFLGEKSPLYGRRTGFWRVDPFGMFETGLFFPTKSMEERIKIYAMIGGTPYYNSLFAIHEEFLEALKQVVLTRGGALYEEIEFLLKEEFREPAIYEAILEVMAQGLTTVTKIANAIAVNAKDLSVYLKILTNLKIIRKEHPVTAFKRGRKVQYLLEDNFFLFWYRFVKPNISLVEIGSIQVVIDEIEEQYHQFIGRSIFEGIVKEFINLKNKLNQLPFIIQQLGRWWSKEHEIDLIGLNSKEKKIVFIECKWQEKINAKNILKRMKERAQHVQWYNGDRTEWYIIVGKSFTKKIDDQVYLYDLKDLEKILTPKKNKKLPQDVN